MEYVGCFIDSASRDLPELEWSDAGLMTNERCAAHCIGYAYFGTQVCKTGHITSTSAMPRKGSP